MKEETLFHALFWTLLGLVLLMQFYFRLRVRLAGVRFLPKQTAIQREGRGAFIAWVIGFFLLIALLASYAAEPPWMVALNFWLPAWLRWAGFALGLASLGLWTWTQLALGSLWSAQLQTRAAHHLITSGPYSRIRHPMYTAMSGWGVSLALVTASWFFVGVAVLVFAIFFTRVPREEKMMLERFGDAYRQYQEKTGLFFPK